MTCAHAHAHTLPVGQQLRDAAACVEVRSASNEEQDGATKGTCVARVWRRRDEFKQCKTNPPLTGFELAAETNRKKIHAEHFDTSSDLLCSFVLVSLA